MFKKLLNHRISILATICYMLMAILATVIISLNVYIHYGNSILGRSGDTAVFMEKVKSVRSLYEDCYIDPLDEEKLLDGVVHGMVLGSGDPYGQYYSRERYETARMNQSGQMVGVGITVSKDEEEYLKVLRVTQGSPAETAGFQVGDTVLDIGGIDVRELSIIESRELILGEKDSFIAFMVRRGEDTLKITAKREVFTTVPVSYSTVSNGTVGYILIEDFNDQTPELFEEAMETLSDTPGIRGYVFDVRNNSGGNLDSIYKVLDTLIDKGTLVRLVDKNGKETTYDATPGGYQARMAVLINGSTASAAELFAGTVKERFNGALVGETSYGKWVAQQTFAFTDGSAIVITDRLFYTGEGNNYNNVGLTPDVEAELLLDYYDNPYLLNELTDLQLKAAIDSLS